MSVLNGALQNYVRNFVVELFSHKLLSGWRLNSYR